MVVLSSKSTNFCDLPDFIIIYLYIMHVKVISQKSHLKFHELCTWKCYRQNHIWISTNYARESVIAKITFEVSRIFCDLSSNVLFVMRIPVTNLFPVWKMHQSISCNRIFLWHLKRHIRTVHEKKLDFTCNECGKSFGLSHTIREGHKDYNCGICN